MNQSIDNLRALVTEYCVEIGADPMLVQGAGGNVSWKEGGTLWVKASGTWLADSEHKDIFVPVDLNDLQNSISKGDYSVTPRVQGESTLRPSIETLLHALMPHKIVVHIHAIMPLSFLVAENSEKKITLKLSEDINWAIVDYQKPGAALAEAVSLAINTFPNVQVLLLKNHGVVIGGNDIDEIRKCLRSLLNSLNTQPVYAQVTLELPDPFSIEGYTYTPVSDVSVHDLALIPELYERLKSDWALYPDHVVFLGPQANFYNSIESLKEELNHRSLPELIFLKGLGVYSLPSFGVAKQVQLKCYYDISVRQPREQHLRKLNDKEIAELLNWNAEQYRQQLAK